MSEHVGDEDVVFNTSDFFMTDYEAEREIEMKASSAVQNAFSHSAAGLTVGKPIKPLSPDLKAMSKSKKPPRERVRKRDRNGKEKTNIKIFALASFKDIRLFIITESFVSFILFLRI